MHYKQHRRFLRHALSFPFIWMMLIPIVITDVFVEVYHRICFPLYGISYISRKNYIRVDRHKLEYLSFFDKINCTYCAYANGFAHYITAIAGETEKYWCGIKHAPVDGFKEPEHHKDFSKYGDKTEYEEKYCKLSKKT